MRIGNIPLHTILIPFLVAFLPGHWVLSMMAMFTRYTGYQEAAIYMLWPGVLIGWAAIIFGVMEFFRYAKSDEDNGFQRLILHALLNFSVIMVFTVILLATYHNPSTSVYLPDLAVVVVEGIAVMALILGCYFGASVAFRRLRF